MLAPEIIVTRKTQPLIQQAKQASAAKRLNYKDAGIQMEENVRDSSAKEVQTDDFNRLPGDSSPLMKESPTKVIGAGSKSTHPSTSAEITPIRKQTEVI